MEGTLPASRVLASQIPGYDGGEVDTNETVEVMFPLNVRKYLRSSCNACNELFICVYSCSAIPLDAKYNMEWNVFIILW